LAAVFQPGLILEMSSELDQPATKRDLETLKEDLHKFILEREAASIRWFVTAQIVYFALTLGAMYFMLSRLPKS
jgi:hypothetical protein